jgi:ABC-type polysaccharide/polyol phosphate transport system ATPase subunit
VTDAQITVTGVGKRFVKYVDTPTLISRIPRPGRTKRSMLWALRGANFEIAPGESVGVIGRNGSGKSTLLRMLAGVTAPTEGRVKIRGRVAPLIAVGVGFHPELTGRENVYVNGTVLGLTKAEMDDRFDEIVRFAEIKPFIDTPVKFYSSGMFVRLGFAVSVLADPDVLLVDEVLAVGDINFQLKCFDRMAQLQESGTTIVVVSHNLNAVRNMCKRAILIHDGEMRFDGSTNDAISMYHDLLAEPRPGMEDDVPAPGEIQTDIIGEVLSFELLGADGQRTKHVNAGDTVRFEMRLRVDKPVASPIVALAMYNSAGIRVYGTNSAWDNEDRLAAGSVAVFTFTVPISLATDSFTAIISVISARGATHIIPVAPLLFYVAGSGAVGIVDLGGRLEITAEAPAPAAPAANGDDATHVERAFADPSAPST